MFTGIVEDVGKVDHIDPLEAGKRLTITTSLPTTELTLGDSIAIDGACMTVVALADRAFTVEVSSESLRRTTLGERATGDRVNLERSVRVGDRLGGHFVTGHIDGVGKVADIRPEGESSLYTFGVTAELARLLVEKGSVAVDGISLTCFRCEDSSFSVAVIRHTMEATTLGAKRPGARVNIENDLIGKYVDRLLVVPRGR